MNGLKEETAAALPGNATAFQRTLHLNHKPITGHEATSKAETSLFAGFALRGFSVHRAAGGYVVGRWGLSRVCSDFEALTAFANQVGVQC